MEAAKKPASYILVLTVLLTACSGTSGLDTSAKPDFDNLNAQAALGYPKAAYELGVQYYLGQHTTKHDAKAYAWLSVAKTEGYPDADAVLSKLTKSMSSDQIAQGQDLASSVVESLWSEGGALRDAERRSAVNNMLNAILQYEIEHNGQPPQAIMQMPYTIDPNNPKPADNALYDCGEIGKKCYFEICATTGSACNGLLDFQDSLKPYLLPCLKTPPQRHQVQASVWRKKILLMGKSASRYLRVSLKQRETR
jgi:hypothetical protein